mmetsp:Transcript_1604/g.3270  ORF Transcript_1604/g.3270 Transcript_1604/m.3270 type:complete len:345 (-) Transcript_1604:268-1302(-)
MLDFKLSISFFSASTWRIKSELISFIFVSIFIESSREWRSAPAFSSSFRFSDLSSSSTLFTCSKSFRASFNADSTSLLLPFILARAAFTLSNFLVSVEFSPFSFAATTSALALSLSSSRTESSFVDCRLLLFSAISLFRISSSRRILSISSVSLAVVGLDGGGRSFALIASKAECAELSSFRIAIFNSFCFINSTSILSISACCAFILFSTSAVRLRIFRISAANFSTLPSFAILPSVAASAAAALCLAAFSASSSFFICFAVLSLGRDDSSCSTRSLYASMVPSRSRFAASASSSLSLDSCKLWLCCLHNTEIFSKLRCSVLIVMARFDSSFFWSSNFSMRAW